jgi:hypothetical protein
MEVFSTWVWVRNVLVGISKNTPVLPVVRVAFAFVEMLFLSLPVPTEKKL